jgi:LuxR family maltose regulon positive regulatory protein
MQNIERLPALAVKIAWALVFLRRHHKLRPLLPVLEGAAAHGIDASVVLAMRAVVEDDIPLAFRLVEPMQLTHVDVGGFRAFELGAAANLSGYRALISGDFAAVQEMCMVARAHNQRANAAFSGAYSVALQGISLVMQGKLTEALYQYGAGLAEQNVESEKSFAAASLVSVYTHALYERGDLDSAESMFLRLNDSIAASVLPDFLALGFLAMVRIHAAKDRMARANDVLNEAEQLGHCAGWPRLLRAMSWERVRQAVVAGELDRARALASRIATAPEFDLPPGWMMYSDAIEGDTIGALRLAAHCAQKSAISQLAAQAEMARRQQRIYRLIKLRIIEAIAHQRQGNDEQARRVLGRALQLAAPQGFSRLFLDEGPAVVPLLQSMHRSMDARSVEHDPAMTDQGEFISQLLRSAGLPQQTFASASEARFQPLEPLTDRERRILVFLAHGLSNKDMAPRIYVSENTIKFHLKNIYSKLAVNSRMQAINAARQMGLIK